MVKWCPQNNPIRLVLGSIKKEVPPVPLRMFPAEEAEDGRILVCLG